jgi:hypothetical protein
LKDDEDAATEMPKDSPHLEWWEEAKRKAKEEDDEMLEDQEAHLESFATARKEEMTRVAAAQVVHVESSPRRHGRVPACPQFPVGRFAEVARIWKAVAERRKAFEGDATCSSNGKGGATAATSSSPRMRRSHVLRVALIS